MADGDPVIVEFEGYPEPITGVLVDHSEDWRNVTVQTSPGATMNGVVKHIQSASLLK